MIDKTKTFILEALFELYGVLGKCFISIAKKRIKNDKAFRYWNRQIDKCLDKRDDILEQLFT